MRAYAIMLTLVLLCCGCARTVYVPVESVTEHADTVHSVKFRMDSVIFRDSVAVARKGDTVYLNRYTDRYRVRERIDTLYRSVTDSVKVPVPYPVERQLSRWERTKMDYGGEAITALVVILIAAIVWLIKKFRK